MRFIEDLDYLSPSSELYAPQSERGTIRISRTTGRPVSDKEFILSPESFADEIIRKNVAKQAEPEIVARWNRRLASVMTDEDRRRASFEAAQRSANQERDRNSQRQRQQRYDFAFTTKGRRNEIPRTVFNTDAWTVAAGKTLFSRRFATKLLALPCIERSVRKEVMFARKKAGKGHRVKHKQAKFGWIWC